MNKPLVYYSVALFMGCFCSVIYINQPIIGAVLAASFLVIMLITESKKFYIFIFSFFMLGALSFYLYFKKDITEDKIIKIRIIQKSKFYAVGDYEGRKINLSGNVFSLIEGEIAEVNGSFTKENNYEKGSIGNLKITDIQSEKEDFICNIYAYKRKLYNKFVAYLDEEKAGIVMSLCFGDTKYLSEDKKNDLKKLGVVHAISVSGMHMAVIYKILESILGIWSALFISLLYVIFTGSAAATVRSFIMIAILKFSKE